MRHEAIVMVEALDRPVAEVHLADPATEAAALQGAALDAAVILLDHLVIPDPAAGPYAAGANASGEPVLTAAADANLDLNVAGAIPVETDVPLDIGLAGGVHEIMAFDAGSHNGSPPDGLEGSLDTLARSDALENIDGGEQNVLTLLEEAEVFGPASPVVNPEWESYASSVRDTYDALTSGNSTGADDQGPEFGGFDLLPIGSLLAFAQGQIAAFGQDLAPSSDSTLPDTDALMAIASTDWTAQGLDAQLEALNTVAALFSGTGGDNDVIAYQDLIDDGQEVLTFGSEGVLDEGQTGNALLAQPLEAQHQQAAALSSGFPLDGHDLLMDPFSTLDPSTFG